jgi:chromosomal replication initiation ATPase DnaA
MQHSAHTGANAPIAAGARFRSRRLLEARRTDVAGQRLLDLVGRRRGLPPALLLHTSRCRAEVALARQMAMYLMHVGLGRQYAEVGRFFGRDRTTVWYACGLIEDMRDDPAFDAELEELTKALEQGADGEAADVAC